MREETIQDAVVLSVEPDRIMVRIDKEAEECDGCHTCALKSMCRGKRDEHLELPVPLETGASRPGPGETVRIAYRAANAATAALAMFLPSLLGLFFGGFAASRLFGEGDGVFLLGCFGGLALGLAVSVVLARKSTALRPEIRLLPPA